MMEERRRPPSWPLGGDSAPELDHHQCPDAKCRRRRRRPVELMGAVQQRNSTSGAKRRRPPPKRPALATSVPLFILLHLHLLLLLWTAPAESVDCFKCSSRNRSNLACEDPFHNLNTTRVTMPILPEPAPVLIYHTPCYAGRKNREGLFPASACIKLTGVFENTGETLIVRHCALDSGSLTQDTELARMSHCGKFQFEGDLLKGCVVACPEDGCNSAPAANQTGGWPLLMIWLSLACALLMNGARLV